MTNEMYHGSHKGAMTLHLGLCLTDCPAIAGSYAGKGKVFSIRVNADGLTIRKIDGYDRNIDTAPGDSDESLAALAAEGVDIVIFSDEDNRGRAHDTYRIVSDRALSALSQIAEIE